jgi:hypothetical protein
MGGFPVGCVDDMAEYVFADGELAQEFARLPRKGLVLRGSLGRGRSPTYNTRFLVNHKKMAATRLENKKKEKDIKHNHMHRRNGTSTSTSRLQKEISVPTSHL